MAFKRRRNPRKKRFGKKAHRMFKTMLRQKTKRGNQIVAKIRTQEVISNTAANTLSTGVFVNEVGNAQDWSSYDAIYDTFRVCAIKIKWIPYLNSTTALSAYSPMYVAWDLDHNTLATLDSVNEIIQYENCKFKNAYRPWTYFVKCPKIVSDGASFMFQGGYCDVNTYASLPGVIGVYNENPNGAGTALGNLIVTYYVSFKNRR